MRERRWTMAADAYGLFLWSIISFSLSISLGDFCICSHTTINDYKKASEQTMSMVLGSLFFCMGKREREWVSEVRSDGRHIFLKEVHSFILWQNFSFSLFSISLYLCLKFLDGIFSERRSLIHVCIHTHKRWFNQKRFVFIHIENLTNQHNFASSFSSSHSSSYSCSWREMPEKLLWHIFRNIFSSSTSHYCVCAHTEWYLWFFILFKTFPITA